VAMNPGAGFNSIDDVRAAFATQHYIADRPLALTLKIAADLDKPVLLEGEAGVGKTEVAKVLAAVLETPLIRLQCYEGLDANTTLYEWNYARQILHIRMAEHDEDQRAALEKTIFNDEFLLDRPLLQAIRHPGPRPVVLLIDEVDRADEEFEAFLLEILSDFQITVPEIGTFTATHRPRVVLTSNRTRELNDALKRRCLYLWIDYPSPEKEIEIILHRVPGIEASFAQAIAEVMQRLREVDFYKRPGIAETLDWSRTLLGLGIGELNATVMADTAGVILKYHDDIERLREIGADRIIGGDAAAGAG
jgi:MoxR-like ATPase